MKFGMIDQENSTSLQTIEKGKNELMRLDKFLTEMGLGTRSEVNEDFENKNRSQSMERSLQNRKQRLNRKTTRYLNKGEPVTYCEY